MFTKQILPLNRIIRLRQSREITRISAADSQSSTSKQDVEFYMKIFGKLYFPHWSFVFNLDVNFNYILGLNYAKTNAILNKNANLCTADKKDVEESANFLKMDRKYSNAEIQDRPNVLILNESTLDNRTKVMEESSFRQVLLSFLVKYVSIMNKKVNVLKAHDYINPEANVAKNLAEHLKLNVLVKDYIGENISINELRKKLLNIYLKDKLSCSNENIIKLWRTYPRLKHRNFEYITATVDILKNSLYFSNERIIKNGYLLYADPKNIINMLNEIPKIAGHGK